MVLFSSAGRTDFSSIRKVTDMSQYNSTQHNNAKHIGTYNTSIQPNKAKWYSS